ncbi:unnamed protein product [Rotaria sp. Silwood1]|nr:unnamed protein product [Rotaria sp. Silwood1]
MIYSPGCFVSEFDLSESFELPPIPITPDSIGLSIAILSVVFIIFLIAVCKWTRCLCFKLNPNNNDQTESVSSVIQSDRSTIHRYSQRPRGQIQRFLSCDHLGDVDRYVCTARNGLLSPPLPSYNRCHSNKVNLTDVTNTSASSGIGRELAKELVRLSPSTRLVLSARREEELRLLAAELQLDADHCLVLPLDLETHECGFQSKVDIVLDRFDHIDVLINNAGVSQRSLIKETKYIVDTRLMSINFLGTVTLSKAVLLHFIQRQKGHFVVVTSVAGYAATALRSSYAASKHALHAFFDSLRLEHAKDHIDVTIACPGFVKTDISLNAFEGSGQLHKKMDPKTEKGTDPTVCAYDILCGIAARKHEIYVGHLAVVVVYIRRLFPQLLYRILLRTESA